MLDDGTTIWAKRLNKLTLSGKVLMMVVGGVVEAEFCVTDFAKGWRVFGGLVEPRKGIGCGCFKRGGRLRQLLRRGVQLVVWSAPGYQTVLRLYAPRTSNTGLLATRVRPSATLPRNSRRKPRRPWVPITTRSAGHRLASSSIAS
jgi:hypothetical protein